MVDKKIQTEVDKWESRTHVYVGFFAHYVELEGFFQADELSEIASIQRKRLKRSSKPLQSNQQRLFDGTP